MLKNLTFVQNRNAGQNFWSKTENFIKSSYLAKIEMFAKN